MLFSFPAVGLAKTDYPDTPPRNGAENQHVEAVIQIAQRDEPRLRVCLAHVLPDMRGLEIKIGDTRERKSTT
jgi:hypothetical protein